jgi:hypothetical protein
LDDPAQVQRLADRFLCLAWRSRLNKPLYNMRVRRAEAIA